MKATATVVNPENVSVTIALTMTVRQWQEIQNVLKSEGGWHPCGVAGSLIRQSLDKALGQITEVHQAEQ